MQSKTIVFVVLISCLTSIGTSLLIGHTRDSVAEPTTDEPTENAQIDELKVSLLRLEQEYSELRSELANKVQRPFVSSQSAQAAAPLNEIQEVPEVIEEDVQAIQAEQFRNRLLASRERDGRRANLIQNGFSDEEATWILQQESDIRLESLNAQYQARKKQAELDTQNGTNVKTRNEQLKDKLGEDYYERYLEANGYPTSVRIGSVLEGSPGANAGLQPGDRILSYDGQRVFNVRELNGLTILGDEGKSVLVELERDGSPVQITIPRGPIGIVSGRGGRGRF